MGGETTPAGGPAVLIADDDEAVCFGLAREVRRRGLVPLVAADGPGAVRLARVHAGRLVGAVLDLRMPGADGAEVAARLAEVAPGVPVVLMTAHHAAVRRPGLFRAVLEKPFDLAAFAAVLTGFLGGTVSRAG